MYVDCINYAESNYDYGILSNLGQKLPYNNNSASSTSSVVKYTFYGKQSSNVVTVEYDLPASEDNTFIQIKFIKDSSQHSNNDTLQFKIRFE